MLDQSTNMASFRFKPFLFLVTLFGMHARIASSICQGDWHNFGNSGKCFRVFDQPTMTHSYIDIRTTCQQMSEPGFNIDIASMTLPDEETFLRAYLTANQPQSQFLWIGLEPVIQVGNQEVDASTTHFKWADNSVHDPGSREGPQAVAIFLPGFIHPEPRTPKYALIDASTRSSILCMYIPE